MPLNHQKYIIDSIGKFGREAKWQNSPHYKRVIATLFSLLHTHSTTTSHMEGSQWQHYLREEAEQPNTELQGVCHVCL